MDPEELDERRRAAENDAVSVRRAIPQITLLNEPLRHREGDGSLTAAAWGGSSRRRAAEPVAAEASTPVVAVHVDRLRSAPRDLGFDAAARQRSAVERGDDRRIDP